MATLHKIKITKGPNSGQENALLAGIDGVLTLANKTTVTVEVQLIPWNIHTMLMPTVSGTRVLLDIESDLVSHVVTQVLGLLSASFDRALMWTTSLSMDTAPSNASRLFKTKAFELVVSVPQCLRATLVHRMGSLIRSQARKSKRPMDEREYTNVVEVTQTQNTVLERTAQGFVLHVHRDDETEMEMDKGLLGGMEADFKDQNYYILITAWSDIEEMCLSDLEVPVGSGLVFRGSNGSVLRP